MNGRRFLWFGKRPCCKTIKMEGQPLPGVARPSMSMMQRLKELSMKGGLMNPINDIKAFKRDRHDRHMHKHHFYANENIDFSKRLIK